MREKLKYFIINKEYDYRRGIAENMEVHDNALCYISKKKYGVGRFLTRIFNAGESETDWHRLVIHHENAEDEDIRVTVYATDEIMIKVRNKETTIFDIFEDTALTLSEKLEMFRPLLKKQVSGVSDILLHDVRGQFLWLLIEQYSSHDAPSRINDIRIFLPAESWIDRMPQIYRRSDSKGHFLERYLGIFQTYYEELDAEIEGIANHFDPECAESEYLEMLAGWLSISETSVWTEEQLRRLLLNAVQLYRMRGTKEGLSRLLELYMGEKPFIIEGFSVREKTGMSKNERVLTEMYGNSPYTVTVLVKPGYDIEVIRRLAQEMIPATTELRLVELDPYIFLDNYAYLGVNSSLGNYRPAVLDGKSPLMLLTLGGTPPEKDQEKGGNPETDGE